MAKKTHTAEKKSVVPIPQTPTQPETPAAKRMFPDWLYSFRLQAAVIAVLAFSIYCNTFSHEYALDDLIVIVKNEYVYEGFAGLGGIFTKDAFDSYCRQSNSTNSLAGGRYRPLSIGTFAIEQQFLGPVPVSQVDSVVNNARMPGKQLDDLRHAMHIRHVFNVLWFTLSVIVLLYFLRYVVFPRNHLIPFIATLLFTVHPIHTEVVANVKSLDEILSFLFICLTFIFAFKYREHNKIWLLAAALLSYFLAFLSKEYAITLVVLLPLSFWLFRKEAVGKSISATLPYLLVVIIYAALRFQAVGAMNGGGDDSDIWNNPYAFATAAQKTPTQIATLMNYLKLLVFPHPLSSDYSYNTIPYKDFSNPLVWLSILIHLAMLAGGVYFLKKRHVFGFAIAFYVANLLLVCNLIYDLGGTMGERLIYHSSLGFCIVLAYLLYGGAEKMRSESTGRLVLATMVTTIVILCSGKTIARNNDWKNDFTLFSNDVKVVPNSLLVNADLGVAVLDKADLEKDEQKKAERLRTGIKYLDKALSLDSVCLPALLNRALANFKLKNPDAARKDYETVIKLLPDYGPLAELYYNVGVLYYFDKKYTKAIEVWQNVLKFRPTYTDAQKNINIAMHDMAMSGQQPNTSTAQPK